jgi:hypothetical protein
MSKLGAAPAGVYADDGVTLQALIDGAGNEYSVNPSTNLIQMTGNISLSASPGTSVIFVNNSANNYTITLAAAGIGNFSVENLGSGSIQILTPPENQWPYSTDFSSTAWANYNTNHTGTNNTVASPVTGNITGATIGVTGGNAFSITNNITNLTPNIEYTLEFYVKGNAGSIGQMLGFGVQSNVSGTPVASAKLTANWQRIFLKFVTTNTNGTQLFLNFSGGTNCPGSITSGNSFYISDARIFRGDYKTFAQTNGSVINGVTNILGGDLLNSSFVPTNTIANANYPRLDVQESGAGNYTISPNQQTNVVVLPEQNSAFLLIKSTASRGETFVLAASDSLNPYASDYILTGSNDDVIISQAVNSLRGKGGCVKLRAGTFLLNSPINMDADWVTLRGECVPHWGGYNNPWSAGGVAEESFPGGSKLKMLTAGTDIIHIGTTYINEQRHKGLGFEDLYFYGSQIDGSVTTQYGIYDPVNTDVSKIKGCFFHNLVLNCIN